MKLLQVKVSKKQLEEIKESKELSFEVEYDQLSSVFEMYESGDPVEDPDYKDVYLMEKYDGVVLLQCRTKFPYKVVTAVPESLAIPYADDEVLKMQKVYYTLGEPIDKEALKEAEIVKI